MFVTTKRIFRRDKSIFVLSRQDYFLSRQTGVCHVPCSHVLPCSHVFVVTKVCLSRRRFCHDKIMFVTTNNSVATKYKLTFVATEDFFVATNTCLSQQNFCRDTQMILAATPASDTFLACFSCKSAVWWWPLTVLIKLLGSRRSGGGR